MGIFGGTMRGLLGLLFIIVFLTVSQYMENNKSKVDDESVLEKMDKIEKNIEKRLEKIEKRLDLIENVEIAPDEGATPIKKCDMDSKNLECVLEMGDV
jgi:GTP-binding protein EngB required for normal cell division